MKLTTNFTLDELTRSTTAQRLKLDNTPPAAVQWQLAKTATMLQRIRDAIKKPITVTSAYRSPAVNKAVGGRTSSDHCMGFAADIVVPGMTAYELAKAIEPKLIDWGIGQLILEGIAGKQWVHVSTDPVDKPINRVLTITDAGARPGILEI